MSRLRTVSRAKGSIAVPIGRGELLAQFQVIGKPKTAGSKTSFVPKRKDGSVVTRKDGSPMVVTKDDAGTPGEQWRLAVGETALRAVGADPHDPFAEDFELLDEPLWLEVTYYFKRPKSHYRSGRNAHLLKDRAPTFPAMKPDVGKLTRAVHDALTGVLYRDDALIVRNCEQKLFGVPERAEVAVYRALAVGVELYEPEPEQAALAV